MSIFSTGTELAGSRPAKAAVPATVRSLRFRIALGFGLLAVLLTAALALVIGELATNLARKEIGRYLTRLSIEMRDKIDTGMSERVAEIGMLANLDTSIDGPRNPGLRKTMLNELKRATPDYSWLGYTDATGRVVVSLADLLQGADMSGRVWFRRAMTAPYIGDVRDATLLPRTGAELPRIVDIAFPLREAGRVYGAVSGYVSWSWVGRLRDAIESNAPPEAPFELIVLSADNKVLMGPAGLMGTTLPLTERSPSRLRAYDARLERWADGVTYLAGTSATRGFGDYQGIGWIVVARQRAEFAFAPVRLLQQRIAIAGGLIALLAIVLGWWIATRVSGPLAEISAAADAISRGSRRVQIPSEGGYAEVERLSSSLRRMLANLTAHEEDLRLAQNRLETRVRERTAELTKARAETELEAADHSVARDEATAAKDRLSLAMEASRLVLWDYDVPSGKVALSEAWSALLGGDAVPTTETMASLTGLVPEEDRSAVQAAIASALKGPDSSYRVEHRVRTASGVPVWIVSEGRVVERDASGRAVRMIGTNRDITERMHSANALLESEARFKGAFEHSATGMSLIGLDGRWLKVNRALCEITGYSEAELLARSFQNLTHPDDLRIGPASLGDLLSGKRESIQIEKRYLHKLGQEVWVLVNLSLVRDKAGNPEHFISQILDVSERRKLQERVEHLALHDPLTDLPNSRLLLDRLQQALAAAQRAKRPIGVMYIDLDGFKPVNDTYGHKAGDLVLKEFAIRLKSILRAVDSVARVGGDEFVAILAEIADTADATKAADRLLAAMAVPFDIGQTAVTLSASIGLALYPANGDDAQTLLQRADSAMYSAKRAGKNSYRFFAGDPK